jgi:hypothetical protein
VTLYLVACFDDRLVEGGAAGLAVAAAAGGDAERFGSVVERATGVAWLGAHVGLDHSADRAAALVGAVTLSAMAVPLWVPVVEPVRLTVSPTQALAEVKPPGWLSDLLS